MSKHTPGTWATSITPAGKSKVIDENGFSICISPSGTREDVANAKLMAAAPELLHALQLAISTPPNEWRSEQREICINAIKKATS